jgi:MinD superfamily P-loop ATPase
MVFAELCHSCGGCVLACPADAIRERPRSIGQLRIGRSAEIRFLEGVLNVGEAMSPPAIRAVKSAASPEDLTILDAPPGTSCPVIETLRGCDRVILVTEPTPFGLYDLTLAVEMVRAMKLPFAVVINRADAGNGRVREYCDRNRIPVLAEIPDDRAVAEAYSRGELASQCNEAFRDTIGRLLDSIGPRQGEAL